MAALIRETVLGTTVRFLSRNSILAYPNSPNATLSGNMKESEQASDTDRDCQEHIKVAW